MSIAASQWTCAGCFKKRDSENTANAISGLVQMERKSKPPIRELNGWVVGNSCPWSLLYFTPGLIGMEVGVAFSRLKRFTRIEMYKDWCTQAHFPFFSVIADIDPQEMSWYAEVSNFEVLRQPIDKAL